MTKLQIARKLQTLSGKYRVRTVKGWGCWVWEYKMRGDDNSKYGWLSAVPIELAAAHFGWEKPE